MIEFIKKEKNIEKSTFRNLILSVFPESFNFAKKVFTQPEFETGLDSINSQYAFVYWLKSVVKPTNIYNDVDGDFLKADTSTVLYENPLEEIKELLLKTNLFSEDYVDKKIQNLEPEEYFENLYYGESETYCFIRIKLD